MTDRAKIARDTEYVQDLPGFKRSDPQYFSDPMIDRLLEIVLLLAGELWTVRNRQFVTEQLLATHGRVTPDLIETFKPSKELKDSLSRQRQDYIRGVFACLSDGKFPDVNEKPFKWVTQPEKEKQN
jgi:hypothetical protein